MVLITGGTRGIGFATAKRFGKEGYIVAVNGVNKDNGVLKEKELKDLGYEAFYFYADVTKE